MKKFSAGVDVLLNSKGAVNIIEVLVAAAISVAAYFSFTNIYELDHDNIVKLEAKWNAQLVAESVANTVSTLKKDVMYQKIVDSTIILDTFYDSESTSPQFSWLKSWVKLSPRIKKVQFKITVYDKDRQTVMSDSGGHCFLTMDHFKRCHKKVYAEAHYNIDRDEKYGEHKVAWTTWIMGKEFPNAF